MDRENIKSRLESLLLIAGKPIAMKKLSKILNIKDVKNISLFLKELNDEYIESNKGFRIVITGEKAQLVTSPENAGFIQKLVTDELQEDLSRAALETLAIIAYRGPISRAEIEMIRGVNCIYILRSLLMRGLVYKKESRKDARVSVYEVSLELLKHFGIQHVKELPDYEILKDKIELKVESPHNDEGEAESFQK